MITAFIQFRLPEPVTQEQARAIFLGTAVKNQDTPGLVRKYYILSMDGMTAGGIYLWRTREDAERLYSDNWKAFVLDKFQALPSVTYFETPIIVDNMTQQIIAD